jgi:hypothetical protein
MFFGGYAYRPRRARPRQPQQNDGRVQFNPQVIVLLAAVLVLWLFNIWTESNRGPDWPRLITFGDSLDRRVFTVFVSPTMQKHFGVPKKWINEMKRENKMTDSMIQEMKTAADEIYIRHLRDRCQRERMFARSHPSCDELMQHGVR